MKKILLITSILAATTGFASAESMTQVVGQCIDMEYYDDILYHNSSIEILGYVEGQPGGMDKLGNPDIIDIIKEDGVIYTGDFNVYESTVCIEKAKGGTIYVLDYEERNPWVEAYGGE